MVTKQNIGFEFDKKKVSELSPMVIDKIENEAYIYDPESLTLEITSLINSLFSIRKRIEKLI